MRINVYSQELTREVTIMEKTSPGPDGNPQTHYGVRFWLKSPPCLHNTPNDDDRSAITFWVPIGESFNHITLSAIFANAATLSLSARS